MKVLIALVALVTVAAASEELYKAFFGDMKELIDNGWDSEFREVALKMYQERQSTDNLCNSEQGYLDAAFTFNAEFDLPKLAAFRRVYRRLGALIVAEGIEGHRSISAATIAFYDAILANDDIPVFCRIALGLEDFRGILYSFISDVTLYVAASNVELLATDYSCAVTTTLDTGRDFLRFAYEFLYRGLRYGDRCIVVNIFLSFIRGAYYECAEGVQDYMVALPNVAFHILFPQCRLPDLPEVFRNPIDYSKWKVHA